MNLTSHARTRCEKRMLPIEVVEDDLEKGTPLIVFEQESEDANERKFDVYYRQDADYSHRYVLILNGEIRLITVMRVRKGFQKRMAGEKR